jgi:hypothetical protein
MSSMPYLGSFDRLPILERAGGRNGPKYQAVRRQDPRLVTQGDTIVDALMSDQLPNRSDRALDAVRLDG